MMKMTTTTKNGIKYLLSSIQEKLNIINMMVAT